MRTAWTILARSVAMVLVFFVALVSLSKLGLQRGERGDLEAAEVSGTDGRRDVPAEVIVTKDRGGLNAADGKVSKKGEYLAAEASLLDITDVTGVTTATDVTESKHEGSKDACSGRARSFVMGFMGHSGSSAIMSTLHRHAQLDVGAQLEPLQRYEENPVLAVDETRRIFNGSVQSGGVPGFKIRPGCFGYTPEPSPEPSLEWVQLVHEYDTRYIGLSRRNYVKKAIGLYNIRFRGDKSAQMGVHEDVEAHCESDPDSCHYPIDNLPFFSALIHSSKAGEDSVRALTDWMPWQCKLQITYEEYLEDTDATMRKIYDFLGIDHSVDIEPNFHKALPDNPCEVVSNYQEVCARLWGCEGLRTYLEDPQNNCTCHDKSRAKEPELCEYRVPAQIVPPVSVHPPKF